jgi:3,4-dihydroxy 2-butanone 4-phosphate synthase / GTP cyclohydrolase II
LVESSDAEAAQVTAGIDTAIETIARGGIVIVTDDEDRENEGDLVMAAAAVTPEAIAFFLQHTSGVICAALPGERLDELGLPPMVHENRDSQGTAFTVTVDLAEGISTGISATDRARTIAALADPGATAADFVRPGHVFPLRSRDGGVLRRGGHTEASVDLARMAGLEPAGLLCEIVTPDRSRMARGAELRELAERHGLPLVSIAELVRHRLRRESLVRHAASGRIPTRHGEFRCDVWRSTIDEAEHVAFVYGDVETDEPVLVRVHSECLTGDLFGSERCDCGSQLNDALDGIVAAGRGVVVYLRGHEGRGIGLSHKLRAYALQDAGRDTVDANLELGFPVDTREYGIGAQILVDLGVGKMRLMTNNPAKYGGLEGFGLDIVERVPLESSPNPENIKYLRAKRERMGHLLEGLDDVL